MSGTAIGPLKVHSSDPGQEFEHYLPDGIHSKDQYLYSIIDEQWQ